MYSSWHSRCSVNGGGEGFIKVMIILTNVLAAVLPLLQPILPEAFQMLP